VGWVHVAGESLSVVGPKAGMLLDYADLTLAVKPIVDAYLDHWHLNDTTKLPAPTSEALAQWLAGKLRPALPWLTHVTIEETCTSRCEYWL
jgi:6-pyruvoyltetrahydropterin/6-carboxytetrahydropterin synthase